MMTSYNPYTNEELGEFEETSKSELEEILSSSKKARNEWSSLSLRERADILRLLPPTIINNTEKILAALVNEVGMPITEARTSTHKLLDRIEKTIDLGEACLVPSTNLIDKKTTNIVSYRPIGTVACIMPWNHPFTIPFWSIVPALLAGNAVVYKPSELTPMVGTVLNETIKSAGLPDGIFQLALGDKQLGGYLALSENVQMISFAGSTVVGVRIYEAAAHTVKRLILENGGKDALIVGKYKNRKILVKNILSGAFRHSGQLCSSVRRVYVLDEDYESLVSDMVNSIGTYKVGNPAEEETLVGPLKTQKQIHGLNDALTDAVSRGAMIECGGYAEGNIFKPTIVTNVTQGMPLVQKELFGPVIGVIRVKNLQEAVSVSNNSIYGLGGSIWHDNVDEAIALAKQMEVGTITINSLPSTNNYCTWHGQKMSGLGKILATEGIKEFVETSNIRYQIP
jgi:acyl-CoA reductase-like NAD-dependent aldehyde dehydrogenase